MERTNFFKLSMADLEARIVKINEWIQAHPTHKRKAELYDIMVEATQMLEARKLVEEGGEGSRLMKDALEVFWGDVPLKYKPGEEQPVKRIEDSMFPEERPEQKALPV